RPLQVPVSALDREHHRRRHERNSAQHHRDPWARSTARLAPSGRIREPAASYPANRRGARLTEDLPTSKPEVMARIAARWAELQGVIESLGPARAEEPLGDGWSAK